jgi:hypothetical protein
VEEEVGSVGAKEVRSSGQGGGALPPDPASTGWGVVDAALKRCEPRWGEDPAAGVGADPARWGAVRWGWRRQAVGWRR